MVQSDSPDLRPREGIPRWQDRAWIVQEFIWSTEIYVCLGKACVLLQKEDFDNDSPMYDDPERYAANPGLSSDNTRSLRLKLHELSAWKSEGRSKNMAGSESHGRVSGQTRQRPSLLHAELDESG